MIKSTSLPCSLKYSATLIAQKAPYLRIKALSSLVATISTVSSSFPPKFFCINSGISRPLSPMSATTLIGALEFLTIIPIRVDFPTPLPAKMPSFCPTPQVKSASMVLTPTGKTSSISPLFIASMG